MELKSNEFRRKNYILDKLGRIQVINEIRENTYICKLSNGKKLKYHFHTSKPIPLTEDWLIKFGFVKKHFFELSWITGGLQIIESNDYWYPSVYSHPEFSHEDDQCVSLNRIKYVHQLQNLYFVLTQKELTF